MKIIRAVLIILTALAVLCSTAYAEEPTPEQIVDEQFLGMDAEIVVLAKVLYGEARGVKSTMQRAAVVWCVLNRVDAGYNDGTIIGVATARRQFAYNRKLKPARYEPFLPLARDVVRRWLLEKQGVCDVGRVLPSNYLWFAGSRGRNRFRDAYKAKKANYWDWSFGNPYPN